MKSRIRWLPSAMRAAFLTSSTVVRTGGGAPRLLNRNMVVMNSSKYKRRTTRNNILTVSRPFFSGAAVGMNARLRQLFLHVCQDTDTMDAVGINYGRLASSPLPHNVAIQKVKDLGANAIKLFDTDHNVLKELSNSGLRVMTAIPNGDLEKYAHDGNACLEYAKSVKSFLDRNVRIEWVAVGNELTASWYQNRYTNLLMPTLINLRDAFAKSSLSGRVKLVVPLDLSILSVSYPPSASEFKPELVPLMKDILYFLKTTVTLLSS